MRAPRERRRPAPVPPRVAGPAPNPIETLQRSAGNRAVQRLLAVQRKPTAEQEKEFAGYVGTPDWGRAAWVLNDWDPGDIAVRIKGMSPRDLESLNEGAWHGGKGKVDTAVRARDPVAATRGALRVLVWGKRWGEAAIQLNLLEHQAALAYVRGLADKKAITGDELRQLVKPMSLRLRRGESMVVDGVTFVVYDTMVRFNGDIVWRNNNPGALKGVSPDAFDWHSIGSDPKGFFIFLDMEAGRRAATLNLAHKAAKFGERSILETMREYASMPTDRPEEYADKIVNALAGQKDLDKRPITPATSFGRLSREQRETAKETIFGTEKTAGTAAGEVGSEESHDSTKLPESMRDLLRK